MAKLKDVMARKSDEVETVVEVRRISTDEAAVVAKLGMSGAYDNEKARRVLNIYLEGLTGRENVSDDDARAVLSILKESATSYQKDLCNKILTRYLGKFDALIAKNKAQLPSVQAVEAQQASTAEEVAA